LDDNREEECSDALRENACMEVEQVRLDATGEEVRSDATHEGRRPDAIHEQARPDAIRKEACWDANHDEARSNTIVRDNYALEHVGVPLVVWKGVVVGNDQVVYGKTIQQILEEVAWRMEDVHGVEDPNSVADTAHRAMVADKVDVVRRAWADGSPGEVSCDGREGDSRPVDDIV